MAKQSAGILLYRKTSDGPEVFLVHPGGPFWAKRDEHAWSIPKGEFAAPEDALDAARREFFEETGFSVAGEFHPLTPIRQAGGKVVYAWTVEGDCDAAAVCSNTFTLEYPPKSGKYKTFPEVDRAYWFPLEAARTRINQGQILLLDELETLLQR